MSEQLYESYGRAHFMCPQLAEWLGHRPWEKLSQQERADHRAKLDRHGHSEFFFQWQPGDHHIEYRNTGEIDVGTGRRLVGNAGVPNCTLCGKQLVLIDGDDPGHDR